MNATKGGRGFSFSRLIALRRSRDSPGLRCAMHAAGAAQAVAELGRLGSRVGCGADRQAGEQIGPLPARVLLIVAGKNSRHRGDSQSKQLPARKHTLGVGWAHTHHVELHPEGAVILVAKVQGLRHLRMLGPEWRAVAPLPLPFRAVSPRVLRGRWRSDGLTGCVACGPGTAAQKLAGWRATAARGYWVEVGADP